MNSVVKPQNIFLEKFSSRNILRISLSVVGVVLLALLILFTIKKQLIDWAQYIQTGQSFIVSFDAIKVKDADDTRETGPMGTLKAGESYLVTYTDADGWLTTGYNQGYIQIVTVPYQSNCANPNSLQLCLWGRLFTFKNNTVIDNEYGVVGHLYLPSKKTFPLMNARQNYLSRSRSGGYPTPVEKKYNLVQKINNKEKVIYSFNSNGGDLIARWEDYLFMKDNSAHEENFTVRWYNIKSQQEGIIDMTLFKDQLKGKGIPYISYLQIINNDLYISLGGYLTPGAIYYLPLPPSGKPMKITDSRNAQIEQMDGRYWIRGGEGDGCWGQRDYSTFDPITKAVKFIGTSNLGCSEGDEEIGIEATGQMIFAYHTNNGGSYPDGQIYQYVTAISIDDPSIKETIIAKEDMPKDITTVVYIKERNQLLLFGGNSYLFDLNTHQLESIGLMPREWVHMSSDEAYISKKFTVEENELCISDYNSSMYLSLNLDTKKLDEQTICSKAIEPTQTPFELKIKEQIQKTFKELNLPKEFSIVEK